VWSWSFVPRTLDPEATTRRVALALLLCVVAAATPAAAQVRGTIFGPGLRQYPIAISPLRGLSGQDAGDLGRQFADIVGRDLELSGIFRVVPRDAHIELPESSGTTAGEINFDNWSVIGALALVKGTVESDSGRLTVEARLFDVPQRRAVAGRRYRGATADLRRIANRFADEILLALTGERGPFDSRIAFLSTRGGRFKDVYVMSPDGGDLQRITAENTLNLSPSWSRDASSLLLTSYRAGGPALFTIDLGGRNWTRLSALSGLNVGGAWSPDGSRLVVTLESDGNSDIALLRADGTLERRLTEHWAIDVSPSWSPDGSRVAFCSNRGGSPQIYVMAASGGEPRRVTRSGSYNTSPRWSPKGERIAYVSRVGNRFQVFTVNVDGSDVRQVTSSAGDNEDPSWSPDGRYLVFSSTRGGSSRLYVADASGQSQVQLTAGGGSDSSPAWSGWLDQP
jgi:TolB protein